VRIGIMGKLLKLKIKIMKKSVLNVTQERLKKMENIKVIHKDTNVQNVRKLSLTKGVFILKK
jgi:hypothetical protein